MTGRGTTPENQWAHLAIVLDPASRALSTYLDGGRVAQGRETPFIRNRDKFVRGLAATNPDSFPYNFRDAFGQVQPDGATQLEGWDDQTTRRCGRASSGR